MTSDSFSLHVFSLLFDALIELISELLEHAKVVILELFQLVIHLLALIYCVLLVVLYLPLLHIY